MSTQGWERAQALSEQAAGPWSEEPPEQARPQQPYRVLSADEALGPASKWDALRKQEPQPRKRNGWDMASSAAVHIANGVAAATGMPAWVRAAQSLNRDAEMGRKMDAMQAKAHADYLHDLQKQEAAEEHDRSQYALHPLAEVDGQEMPLSDAMSLTEHRLTDQYRQRAADRSDRESGARVEDIGIDNTRSDSRLEATKSRWHDLDSARADATAATQQNRESRLGLMRDRLEFDKTKPTGKGATGGHKNPSLADIKNAEAMVKTQFLMENPHRPRQAAPPLSHMEMVKRRNQILAENGFDLGDDPTVGLPDPTSIRGGADARP